MNEKRGVVYVCERKGGLHRKNLCENVECDYDGLSSAKVISYLILSYLSASSVCGDISSIVSALKGISMETFTDVTTIYLYILKNTSLDTNSVDI